MAVVIKKCGCKGNPTQSSDYQDKRYGKDNRVMNLNSKKDGAECTVCGKEHKNKPE